MARVGTRRRPSESLGERVHDGANDIVAGSTEQRYRAQLRRIHERVRAVAPDTALYAIPQPDWSLSSAGASFGAPADIARAIERFNFVAREEAERAGGTYLDIFPLIREQMHRKMLAPDGLHPHPRPRTRSGPPLCASGSSSLPSPGSAWRP